MFKNTASQDVQYVLCIGERIVLTTSDASLDYSFGMMPTCNPVRKYTMLHC